MPPRSISRPLALASAVALSATTALVGATAAQASHPGSGSVLSASNGTDTIRFNGGSTLRLGNQDSGITTVNGAAWAPDGSRAIFATESGDIATLRHNDGGNWWWVSPKWDGAPDVEYRSPVYRSEGIGVLWSAKEAGSPWRIEAQVASGGFPPRQITPGDGRHYLNPDSGPGALFVYQVQGGSADAPSGPSEVGVFDGSSFQEILDDASNPSVSPNGKRVAFVRGGQIYAADIDGTGVIAITSNAVTHDHPTWSPDGNTIAFSNGSGVATAPANGSGAANPTPVSGLSGVPSYQPRRTDTVARLAGANRFTTGTAVSQAHWATAADQGDARQFADAVVLSRSDVFADALGGAALAAAKQGPLLMTTPTALNADIEAEIKRILPLGKTVYLLGSPGALSTAVEDRIKALGYQTERIAGSDRFTTSVAIANEINPNPTYVLAATGMNFPDALAAGAAAGSFNVPGSGQSAVVVLTNDYALTAGTKTYLDRVRSTSQIVGIGKQGAGATLPYFPIEIYGDSRYETSLFVAWSFFGGTDFAGLATGTNWPDALSGGALMATINGPLLLTQGNSSTLSFEPELFLDEHSGSLDTALIFGSAAVVSAGQQAPIGSWISGPGSYTVVNNPTNIGIVDLDRGTSSTARAAAADPSQVRTPEQLEAAVEGLKDRLEQR
ncbi:cell wall-binding repeat-containing protein [Micromonospora sp. WMMD1102]|uniref:cell wall-binding repeat-containing protein n=1 Tax=Micromonospora sp. WMMD1102 TaxID=3016105 RepID=UPI002414DE9B|nr:cell wall-binding repeat-containing protein [Micromonospora sp. WMMD1102]MDG4791162.1 cell wall-binding repeat-containing protein [Micromonospora sp. WMMD1102]